MTILDGMKAVFVVSLVTQLATIGIYLWGNRKRPHSSFKVLLVSAIFTFAYFLFTTVSYFVEISGDLATNLFRYGLFFAFPALLLWAIGMLKLVKCFVVMVPPEPPVPPPNEDKWGPQ